jgi:hypothetical protein
MKTFKVGDTIAFRARTNGDPAVDNPTAQVYDAANAVSGPALTLGDGLTQVPETKIVVGSFVPSTIGEWSVNIVDDAGMDVVKQYAVRDTSIETVGTGIAAVGAGIAAVDNKINAQAVVLQEILANTAGGGHFG